MQWNIFDFTLFIVSEIPFSEIEPFWAIYFFIEFGNSIDSDQLLPNCFMSTNLPVVSTCPKTKWPDTSSPIFKEFSKLSKVPFFQYFALVFSNVSLEISAVNLFLEKEVTVKQIPEQQIEEPILYPLRFDWISMLKKSFDFENLEILRND